VDVFHEYVRPVLNPQLTEYCINLTGIRQVRRMAGCRASRVLKLMRGIFSSLCASRRMPAGDGRQERSFSPG